MSFTRPAVNLDHRHSLDSLVTPQSAARFRPFHPRNFSKVILEPSRGFASPRVPSITFRAKRGLGKETWTGVFLRERGGGRRGWGFVIGKRSREGLSRVRDAMFPDPTADNYLVRQSRGSREQQTSVYT